MEVINNYFFFYPMEPFYIIYQSYQRHTLHRNDLNMDQIYDINHERKVRNIRTQR